MIEDRSVLTRSSAPPDIVVRYGDFKEQIADIRYGKNTALHRPLVILLHGGFWRPEYDRIHTGSMAVAIATAGWTIASLEYRRIPGDPDATLDDVNLAISQLPTLLTYHNGKTIVMGHSAGGQLTLWAAVKRVTSALIGVLALGPIADLCYAYEQALDDNAVLAFLGAPPIKRSDVDPCQMPAPQIATTIIHGKKDMIAPVAMSENYMAQHTKTRLVRPDDCGHFALIDPLSAAWPRIIQELNLLST